MEVLKVKEVSEILKINKQTVLRIIALREIETKKLAGLKKPEYRIRREWIDEYLNYQNKLFKKIK